MRERDHEYAEFRYWGHAELRCIFIGCRERNRKLPNGCPKCGAGPYHRDCLAQHMRWCGNVFPDELVRAEMRW